MLIRLLVLLVAYVQLVQAANPCDGRIVVVINDAGDWIAYTTQQFNDEKNLVKKLFTAPYFDHFERLAIGSYLGIDATLSNFGDFKNETDVANYMDLLKAGEDLTYLAYGLEDVYNKNYTSIPGDQITVVIFVSDLEENEIKASRFYAKKLQDQGVRLVLVGHGNFKYHWITMDLLIRVTNDKSTAFKWDDGKSLPDDDYQSWFKQVLGCPSA